MSAEVLESTRPPLFERAKNIVLTPQDEWRRVAGEQPTSLLMSYVAPLAALAAIAAIGAHLLGAGLTFNADLAWALASALLGVAFAMLSVIVGSLLISWLAPRFGAEAESGRAHQLAAYIATAPLLAGLAVFAPFLAALLLIGAIVYALVSLAIGVRVLMGMPEDKVAPFTLTFAAVSAILLLLVTAVAAPFVDDGRDALRGAVAALRETTGAARPVQDPVQLTAAERRLGKLADAYGARLTVNPASLEEQFPQTLPGGFALQSASSSAQSDLARAEALYRSGGGDEMNLVIIQFSESADVAQTAALIGAEVNRGVEGAYARSQVIDGRLFFEEAGEDRARYGVIGRGVAMTAEGGVTIDQARAAIETIRLQRLELAFGR